MMLNQSFSAENLRIIFDLENRKGNYLEGKYFIDLITIENDIHEVKEFLKNERKKTDLKTYIEQNKKAFNILKELKSKKEEMLQVHLEEVSKKISSEKFEIKVRKAYDQKGKEIYVNSPDVYTFFALKQIQNNFKRLFKIKQSNRFEILSQLIRTLDNDFPKYIIRTDIKAFYESIPHSLLLNKIQNDKSLNFLSKRIILQILKDYKTQAGVVDKGIPRGIGISAYLSELYMRDIDQQIKELANVSFYCRYVDDIIIVFTPNFVGEICDYEAKIKEIIELGHSLTLNTAKSEKFDFTTEQKKNYHLEYLGFKIGFGAGLLKVSLSQKRLDKYRHRLKRSFECYSVESFSSEKKARKLLKQRIRFLTGNTRLTNSKARVHIGIHFSNPVLTDHSQLKGLDELKKYLIIKHVKSPYLQKTLSKMSFEKGFLLKVFHPFSTQDLIEIKNGWKYEK